MTPPTTQVDSPPAHRWGFGAFVLAELVLILSAVFLSAAAGPVGVDEPIPPIVIVVVTALPTMLAAGVAVLATLLRGNGPVIDLRLRWSWPDVRAGLKLGLAGLVLTAVAGVIWARTVGKLDPSSALASVVDAQPMPVALGIVMFVYTWLVGPACEEMIYRGLLWGAIERLRWSRWAAFTLSTAIFAVSHLEPLRTSLLLVIAIPIGWARLVTGRLPASIVAHQINNFVPALGILLMSLGLWR
ncbi:CPBP family intramembrane glutamic endopeptidase [Kutzneria sp. 744]|uniref:CPBP family intramembrane glutamic endopeptidase n=1 Tax=Kutzneria sp. (strain 744) TaxID=345341 RepID=UPI0003EEB77D|nr:type II CAAX endopeptidase family protein [Kutzneria sp. 744]EWM16385.1 membrane protein [Kutzneria sp. 744]